MYIQSMLSSCMCVCVYFELTVRSSWVYVYMYICMYVCSRTKANLNIAEHTQTSTAGFTTTLAERSPLMNKH